MKIWRACCFTVTASLLSSCIAIADELEDAEEVETYQSAQAMFKPLHPAAPTAEFPLTAASISLGRALFFDKRISASGSVSCAVCHQPENYGTDTLPRSIDQVNNIQTRNAQSILNASQNFANNWYGDQANVEAQALATLTSPAGLGHKSDDAAMEKIKAQPEYQELFAQAFPHSRDPITPQNWASAVGAYERTLLTPSPFDAYLQGNRQALNPVAKAGLGRFINLGCIACHNGIAVGAASYQKFGIWADYWLHTKSSHIDKGRFNITNDDNDLYVFRVASLRNVTKTAPYFHDGSVKTLPEAVRIMGKIQLKKTLSEDDVKLIVAFLNTLTGKLPPSFSPPPATGAP